MWQFLLTTVSQRHGNQPEVQRPQQCDNLILCDSILRRVDTRRFSPREKTILRYVRGWANTCSSFIQNNASKYDPKRIFVHMGARDLYDGDIGERFTYLFRNLSAAWP